MEIGWAVMQAAWTGRPEDALAIANAAAALSTQRPGASSSMPERAEALGVL